jgi:hypothetical protein
LRWFVVFIRTVRKKNEWVNLKDRITSFRSCSDYSFSLEAAYNKCEKENRSFVFFFFCYFLFLFYPCWYFFGLNIFLVFIWHLIKVKLFELSAVDHLLFPISSQTKWVMNINFFFIWQFYKQRNIFPRWIIWIIDEDRLILFSIFTCTNRNSIFYKKDW